MQKKGISIHFANGCGKRRYTGRCGVAGSHIGIAPTGGWVGSLLGRLAAAQEVLQQLWQAQRIIVTIYTENYTFVFHNGNICPKYAILSVFTHHPNTQPLTIRRLHSTLNISHSTPQNMPNRGSIHGLSQWETCQAVFRSGMFRNPKDA